MTIQKPLCRPILLYQKERRTTTTSTRLQTSKRMDHMQSLPSPPHQRTYISRPRSIIILQVRHTLGIQQCTNQRRRRMEGSIHYEPRPIRTQSHVLRSHEFPHYIPDHDECHIRRRTARKLANNPHGRHPGTHLRRRHSSQRKGSQSPPKTPTT